MCLHPDSFFTLIPSSKIFLQRRETIRRNRTTDHNGGTECESCCGACRSWRYPSLYSLSVRKVLSWNWFDSGGRTHLELRELWTNELLVQASGLHEAIEISQSELTWRFR
jgi:hypothetical protein